MNNCCFGPGEIFLPAENIDPQKWAVIACDQYTSQPEYWAEAEKIALDAPSTLNLVFPELYLKDEANRAPRISHINQSMKEYLSDGLIRPAVNGFVLVERDTPSGKRLGLLGLIDLETYNFRPGADALIRATEGTVLDRIPPRVKVRENAPLELPHVMLLIDDPKTHIIENLYDRKDQLRKLYDFDLMLGGGHLTGYAVEGEIAEEISQSFAGAQAESNGFLFAVGDGNHSLATAKQCWENVKQSLLSKSDNKAVAEISNYNTPDCDHKSDCDLPTHPARFALVEVVNLHCEALQFEPIHRLLLNASAEALIEGLAEHLQKSGLALVEASPDGSTKSNPLVAGKSSDIEDSATKAPSACCSGSCNLTIATPSSDRVAIAPAATDQAEADQTDAKQVDVDSIQTAQLVFLQDGHYRGFNIAGSYCRIPVDFLQEFLDGYLKAHPEAAIDYIHGHEDLENLVKSTGGCGIFLQKIEKASLFPAIKCGGVLPRKTFSMGEAYEKRYYMESRKIR